METTPFTETAVPLDEHDRDLEERSQKSDNSNRSWKMFGKKVPQSEMVYIGQIVMLYIIILTCLTNLSIGNGDSNLYTALLSSSLGYMLPSPSLKGLKKR